MRRLAPGIIDFEKWCLFVTKAVRFIYEKSETIFKDYNLQLCTFRLLKNKFNGLKFE